MTPVRRPPYAQQFIGVLADEECPELRVAVGLASCATQPGSGQVPVPSRTMRQVLLPIDPRVPGDKSQPNGRWRDAPLVPGFASRPLPQVLADVLIWRSRTAAGEGGQEKFRGIPTFRWGIPVPAADLHALASGGLDEQTLDLFLRACLALNWGGMRHKWSPSLPGIPVTTLGLLHPLAAGFRSGRAAENGVSAGRDEPELALSPDWAARLAAGQVGAVHGEAAARLRQAGWQAVPAPPQGTAGSGLRIAAALVPRCLRPGDVLTKIATQPKSPSSQEQS
jgi:hypothetical protein